MPRKPALTDLQLVVLAHAAQRDERKVLPLPTSIADDERTRAELGKLLSRKLIAPVPVPPAEPCWAGEGDDRVGLASTDAGLAALGLREHEADGGEGTAPALVSEAEPAAAPRRPTKRETVIALLSQPGGASLAELCEATGWLEHSARGAVSLTRTRLHLAHFG